MTEAPLPPRQRWESGVVDALDPAALITPDGPLIREGGTFIAFGDGLIPLLLPGIAAGGFAHLVSDVPHPALADAAPEADEYRGTSAGYGEIPTARQLRQLLDRVEGKVQPAVDRWAEDGAIVDPFRPRLAHPARSDEEFVVLRDRHFAAVRSAVRRTATAIIAPGAIEGLAFEDGMVAAIGPDDPRASGLRPDRSDVREVAEDLRAAIAALRAINPTIRIVLMVSPVPVAATADDAHVLLANGSAKAVLRAAMDRLAGMPGVDYFPALELSPLPFGATLPDGAAIERIVRAFLIACGAAVPDRPAQPAVPAPVPTPASAVDESGTAIQRNTPIARRRRRAEAEPAGTDSPADSGNGEGAVAERVPRKQRKLPRGEAAAPAEGEAAAEPRRLRRRAQADAAATPDREAARAARTEAKERRRREKTEGAPDLSHLTPRERRAHKDYLKSRGGDEDGSA